MCGNVHRKYARVKEITLVTHTLHRSREVYSDLKKMATDATITAPSENDAPTPLYRLFGEYPQVVQTHILTKLDRNSRKFLYDVNRRMRAVIRDGGIELSPRFQV